jgi:hypothetical protein
MIGQRPRSFPISCAFAALLGCGGPADHLPAADAGADAAGQDVAAATPADAAAPPDAPSADAAALAPDLRPVALGLALPGDELYPEGIAVGRDGTFYVGSLREGLILKASAGTFFRGRPFIPAGSNGLVAVLGMLVDDATSTLWVCSSDLPRARLTGTAATALKAFDAASGAPRGSFDFPGGGRCNDLAFDRKGNVYATDSLSPRLLRLPRGGAALEVWIEGPALAGYLNGIALADSAGQDRLYLVTSDAGGLLRIPILPGGGPAAVEPVALSRTLTGPDGLKMLDDTTALVVESSWHLSRITLGESGGQPTGTVTQLARVRRPTTVALHEGSAWVVEGQLLSLNNPDAGGPPELPFAVFRVPVP